MKKGTMRTLSLYLAGAGIIAMLFTAGTFDARNEAPSIKSKENPTRRELYQEDLASPEREAGLWVTSIALLLSSAYLRKKSK